MKQLIFFISIFITYTSIAQPAWQQRVDSKIDVTLDDKRHFLYAYEELTYTNNSPDTLRYIYMHLWPNAYKNDRTPFERQLDQNGNKTFYYSKAADKGYIDSLQFNIDGVAADHYSAENAPDIARIDLPNPLLPGHTIKITTPFRVKIPIVFSRMGHTGQAYYISQWFPKPAVYDQKGWHPISYLDQGEFFSEYGSYDVSITLPANYVVMATGNCTDEKENQWLDELSKKSLPTLKYKTRTKRTADSAIVSSSEMKTLHFHEDNIHDFAWFADKRWLVRKDTVYSPGNNQLVTTWAAFMPSYWENWQKATDYLKETIKHYGKWVGPYRYKTIKAVCGDLRAGGGMEYPTVTVIEKSTSSQLRMVITHEAGHNWFYGMLGSNERDHAWMDEGINTFYEQKTSNDLDLNAPPPVKKERLEDKMGNKPSTHTDKDSIAVNKKKPGMKKSKLDERLVYFERAATHNDQAIDQTSANFEKLNYGLDVYFKTALALRWLEQYMGEEEFGDGMHDYYSTWHFHHPYPEDFWRCMQRHTSKNIDWFFDTMLKTDKKIDFTIIKAKIKGDSTEVTVRNNTGVNAPVLIDAYRNDSLISSAWSWWTDTNIVIDGVRIVSKPYGVTYSVGFPHSFKHTTQTITLPSTAWTTLKIDDVIPDGKSTNDVYRRKALFHHFGLKVKPFVGLNLSDKDRLFVSPAVGYNQYDGIMAGLVFHDLTLPENRFRFVFAPLYSFETKSVVGAGSVGYVWYPENLFKEIMLQVDGKTFHYNEVYQSFPNNHLNAGYTKIAPSLNFTFNEHDPLSKVTRTLTLKGYYIDEDNIDSSYSFVKPYSSIVKKHNNYGAIFYNHNNNRSYNPFSYGARYQMGDDFAKINVVGTIRIDYNKRNKALFVRGFFGKFFAITNTADVISKYELNATYSGMDDYLYDGTYIARSAQNKFASQQISIQEGGFKIPTFNNAARSDNWMATINLKSDLPAGRLPIYLFFDAGLIPNANPSFTHSGSTTLLYDGGVEIHLLNIASLYIPIIMSDDFQNYLTNTYGRKNVFGRSITFTLQFTNLNWLKAPATLLKTVAN